jgi:hypothetical protein
MNFPYASGNFYPMHRFLNGIPSLEGFPSHPEDETIYKRKNISKKYC